MKCCWLQSSEFWLARWHCERLHLGWARRQVHLPAVPQMTAAAKEIKAPALALTSKGCLSQEVEESVYCHFLPACRCVCVLFLCECGLSLFYILCVHWCVLSYHFSWHQNPSDAQKPHQSKSVLTLTVLLFRAWLLFAVRHSFRRSTIMYEELLVALRQRREKWLGKIEINRPARWMSDQ